MKIKLNTARNTLDHKIFFKMNVKITTVRFVVLMKKNQLDQNNWNVKKNVKRIPNILVVLKKNKLINTVTKLIMKILSISKIRNKVGLDV